MNYFFALAFGIGVVAGLRAFAPGAVVAWAAHLGWLNLHNSSLGFMGAIITVVIFSLLALFELFVDLQSSTPKRTAPVPLGARILMGGLCGACLCAASNQSLIIGAILGAIGGLIGAFAGYEIRRRLVATLNIKDIFIALLEGKAARVAASERGQRASFNGVNGMSDMEHARLGNRAGRRQSS